MPPRRMSKPRSPDHGALAQAIEMVIAEDPRMTQETVAEKSGLNIKQVGALVRGQANPTYTTLLKLCNGLRVSPGRLMEITDDVREQGPRG